MKTVFLCTPHKLGNLNQELTGRIKKCGFDVLCAATHSPQDRSSIEIFNTNVDLIRRSDIFVAVLKDYGKDLTWEVGMAYALKMPTIGVDYNAQQSDVMTYFSLEKIIKPEELEATLSPMQQVPTSYQTLSQEQIMKRIATIFLRMFVVLIGIGTRRETPDSRHQRVGHCPC